jgi:hypothetical protein
MEISEDIDLKRRRIEIVEQLRRWIMRKELGPPARLRLRIAINQPCISCIYVEIFERAIVFWIFNLRLLTPRGSIGLS